MSVTIWNQALCSICRAPLGTAFDRRRRKCADCKAKTRAERQKRRAAKLKEDRKLSYEDRKKRDEMEERLLAEAVKEARIEFSGPTWYHGPRLTARIDVKHKAVVGGHGELPASKPIWLGPFPGDMGTTKTRLVKELLEKWGYTNIKDLRASNDARDEKGPDVPT